MKKNLLCTSAIALGVVAAPAVAQEWDLAVHGYFNQHVGYTSNKLKGNGFDAFYINNAGDSVRLSDWDDNGSHDEAVVYTNAEIHFTPSVTLDNGLTFGVNIQLEGNNGRGENEIDESYMEIKGERFGKLILGTENSAGYKSMVAAPTVTSMYINSPSVSQYVPFSAAYAGGFRQAGTSSYTEVAGNNDVQRITYFTPSFNGFVLGVSYAPKGDVAGNAGAYNNGVFDRKDSLNDVIDAGISYNQSWGLYDVSFGARYGTASYGKNVRIGGENPSDPETYGAGLQVGYNGFTLGGAWAYNDSGLNDNRGNSSGWNLGATYDAPGPWAFEAVTYQGRAKNGANDENYYNGFQAIGNGHLDKGKYQAYRIGASRDIGPGVDWDVYGVYVKASSGGKSSDQTRRKVSGYGIGTALNLSF